MRDYIEIIHMNKDGEVLNSFSDEPESPAPSYEIVESLVQSLASDNSEVTLAKIEAMEMAKRGIKSQLGAFLDLYSRDRVGYVAKLSNAISSIEDELFSDEVIGAATISQLINMHKQAGIQMDMVLQFLLRQAGRLEGKPLIDARNVNILGGGAPYVPSNNSLAAMTPRKREEIRRAIDKALISQDAEIKEIDG